MRRLTSRAGAPEANVRTAFVLPGGGSLGAVQVGMLQALRPPEAARQFTLAAAAATQAA